MTDLTAAPLVGYRVWRVSATGELLSINSGYVATPPGYHAWPPGGTAVATDVTGAHFDRGPRRPTPRDQVGLHAYRDLDKAARALPSRHLPNPQKVVLGAIIMWGIVQVHEYGYRAQYAKPLALLDWETVTQPDVDERYELPVLPRDEIARYAR